MSPNSTLGSCNDFEFTFTSILDASSSSHQIEPDPNASFQPPLYETDSESLTDSIARFEKENGRTYHSYRAGSYHFPNDPNEIERLDFQHEILRILFGGRNFFAPFSKKNPPTKILDIATGTGQWAMEMGDDFPDAAIIGTDLSPIQPPYVPPNVRFYIEDSTDEWEYCEAFDFIHTRMTMGCWSDMKAQVIEKAFANLKPGGWMESQEVSIQLYSDDGTLQPDDALKEWTDDIWSASTAANRPLDSGPLLKQWFAEAGFVQVREKVFKLPINSWPRDRRMKELGMLWQQNVLHGLSGFSLALYHRVKGLTPEEIEVNLVRVRRALSDQRTHAYHKIHVVWGRRPYEGEMGYADES